MQSLDVIGNLGSGMQVCVKTSLSCKETFQSFTLDLEMWPSFQPWKAFVDPAWVSVPQPQPSVSSPCVVPSRCTRHETRRAETHTVIPDLMRIYGQMLCKPSLRLGDSPCQGRALPAGMWGRQIGVLAQVLRAAGKGSRAEQKSSWFKAFTYSFLLQINTYFYPWSMWLYSREKKKSLWVSFTQVRLQAFQWVLKAFLNFWIMYLCFSSY